MPRLKLRKQQGVVACLGENPKQFISDLLRYKKKANTKNNLLIEREWEKVMIKKLLMAIFSKFARSHAKQIAKAQKWIDSAQAQFASAIEEAEIAEQEFNKIAESKMAQVEQLLGEVKDANARMKQAENFKTKIKQFIEE
jgi:hypothetical protein